jgi:SAM-dependent methyltransferase
MRLRLSDDGPIEYEDVLTRLRSAYDQGAAHRDTASRRDWKLDERAAFLDRLRAAQAGTLLEIGAGPGHDSAWFQAEGLKVTAVDPSSEMVTLTKDKGVPAYARDVLNLDFPPGSFDAVYSLNALLHVPNKDLPAALSAIHAVLRPGGLFFLGVFGGWEEEGVATNDDHVPARFFSFRSDQQLLTYAAAQFEILDFHIHDDPDARFQSLTLVRPD